MADGYNIRDTKPDAKRPLFREPSAALPFPIQALGALRPAAEAIHELTLAPVAVCAQSVLAAATLAIQAHRDVVLPGAGRRPLTGLFVSVVDSGERKSAVDRLALGAAYAFEGELREAYGTASADYRNAKDTWDHLRAEAKKKAKFDRLALEARLREIGPEPKPPANPMVLVADPTPEALVMHLERRPWGGLFTAEGGLFVGGSAMNDETRMRTGALLNTLWDGDPIRRLRIGTGSTFLPGRRCSAHLMLQPAIAPKLFGDDTLAGIGTLARTLVVAPAGTAGTRFFREPPASAFSTLDEYAARLIGWMRQTPPSKADDPTVLDPVPMTLDADARRVWIAFLDAVEQEQKPGGELHPIRAFASKMAEHAGRLAAVLAAYGNSDAGVVSAEAMVGGIELAKHYAAELLRLQGTANIPPDLKLAQRLLVWWQTQQDPRCHLAIIYQRGLNTIRDAATARRMTTILDDHGWIEPLPAGTVLDGKQRAEAWRLRP